MASSGGSCVGSGIVKDIQDIYGSVLDHRPAVNKEVEYFVKEFEESRKDREVDRLFKVLEIAEELKGTELQKTQALADIHLPKLTAELTVAESIADKLLQKRGSADTQVEAKLEKGRANRTAEWDTFVHEMTAKCVKIDNKSAEKQEEIREAFKKAEDKIFAKKRAAEGGEQ